MPKPSKVSRIRSLIQARQQFTAKSETERDYCYEEAPKLGHRITAVPVNGEYEICPVLTEKEKRLRKE
jgi:hypothetical protein